MAGPVILAVDGDSQTRGTDSGAPVTLDARPDLTRFVVALW